MEEGIDMKELDEHFRGVLGGVGWRVRLERERDSGEEEEEEKISRKEIDRVVRKLKEGKAAGGNDIVNELWKYRGEEVKELFWEICNRIWRGDGWSEEWRREWWCGGEGGGRREGIGL